MYLIFPNIVPFNLLSLRKTIKAIKNPKTPSPDRSENPFVKL